MLHEKDNKAYIHTYSYTHKSYIYILRFRTNGMALAKALAVKTDNPNSILGTYMVEGGN